VRLGGASCILYPCTMDILVIFLILIGVALAAFLVYGYRLPAKWTVSASEEIPRGQEDLFQYLSTIRNWEDWTIWNREAESKFEFAYEGPASGSGATQRWKAARQSGKIQIRTCEFPDRIGFLFSFGQGQHAMVGELRLVPHGSGSTRVFWTTEGDAGQIPSRRIMARMLAPYMQKDFQRSLSRLQGIMSAQAA
jgi:Polyketide cyclase / dehydrase and lipid transport